MMRPRKGNLKSSAFGAPGGLGRGQERGAGTGGDEEREVKNNRDDFSEAVKRTVAERVNRRCSRCDAPTSGPQRDPTKSLNVGVAGHITAAAPGGPRYDSSLTTEQRKGHGNAIWLCQTCGRLVDNDESAFTVQDLQRWKLAAEARALASIGVPAASRSRGLPPLSPEEIEILIAAEANGGEIFVFKSDEEPPYVTTFRHSFNDPADRAVAAVHLEALRSLISRRLLELEGGNLYNLTGSGFMKARELKRLRDSIAVDET